MVELPTTEPLYTAMHNYNTDLAAIPLEYVMVIDFIVFKDVQWDWNEIYWGSNGA